MNNNTRIKVFSSSSHEKVEEEFNTWMRNNGWDIDDIKIFNTKWGHHIYVFYNIG